MATSDARLALVVVAVRLDGFLSGRLLVFRILRLVVAGGKLPLRAWTDVGKAERLGPLQELPDSVEVHFQERCSGVYLVVWPKVALPQSGLRLVDKG